MQSLNSKTLVFAITTIAIIVLYRILPHPVNFAPVVALCLFNGINLKNKFYALVIPLVAIFLSDMFLGGYYQGFYWQYIAYALIVLLSFVSRSNVNPVSVFIVAILSSLVFFLVSNFGVWASTSLYASSLSGLAMCLTAGIPFIKNQLLGDLLWTAVFFGAYEVVKNFAPKTITS